MLVQNVLHPARCDNCKTFAVSDVIIRAESVLNSVARPTGGTVANGKNLIAGKRAVNHKLTSCIIVFRLFKGNFGVFNKAFDCAFTHSVRQKRMLLAEILLNNMVNCICGTGSRLFF